MIPAEAVEAAARAFYGTALDDVTDEDMEYALEGARFALEAAAPILLSHEREQTRLAHLDAMVNRETKREELAAEYRRGYRDGLIDRKQVTAAGVEAAVSRIVSEAKAAALEEVAAHITTRMAAGDTAPVTPAATVAWLRERAEHIRKSIEV